MHELTTLGDLVRRSVITLGDGYRTKQSELSPEGFRIIRVADIWEGQVSLDGPDRVDSSFARQIGEKVARPGDVILTTKGTVGRVAAVPANVGDAVYSPQICWFRVAAQSVLAPGFLQYWLQSEEFKSQASYLQGSTDMAPYISLRDLRATRMTLPPLSDQLRIAEVLGALDASISNAYRQAASLATLRNTLLPELLNGRISIGETMPLSVLANPETAGGGYE